MTCVIRYSLDDADSGSLYDCKCGSSIRDLNHYDLNPSESQVVRSRCATLAKDDVCYPLENSGKDVLLEFYQR